MGDNIIKIGDREYEGGVCTVLANYYIDRDVKTHRNLGIYECVEKICRRHGLDMPDLERMNSDIEKAFEYGLRVRKMNLSGAITEPENRSLINYLKEDLKTTLHSKSSDVLKNILRKVQEKEYKKRKLPEKQREIFDIDGQIKLDL